MTDARVQGPIITVRSSHGHVDVDQDGTIVAVHENSGSEGSLREYKEDIERLDAEECKLFWNEDAPTSIDILDLGMFKRDGSYEGPCKTHRREILRMRMYDGDSISELALDFVRWYDSLEPDDRDDDCLWVYPTRRLATLLSTGFTAADIDYKKLPYPLTIVHDRYSGVYSRGKFTAWNKYPQDIPEEADADDCTCCSFWDDNEIPVGKGDTPDHAIGDLQRQLAAANTTASSPGDADA